MVFEGGGDEGVAEDEAEDEGGPDADVSDGDGVGGDVWIWDDFDCAEDGHGGSDRGGDECFSEGLDEGGGVGVVVAGELGDGHAEGGSGDDAACGDKEGGKVAWDAEMGEDDEGEGDGSCDGVEFLGGAEKVAGFVEGEVDVCGDGDVGEDVEGEDEENGFVFWGGGGGHGGGIVFCFGGPDLYCLMQATKSRLGVVCGWRLHDVHEGIGGACHGGCALGVKVVCAEFRGGLNDKGASGSVDCFHGVFHVADEVGARGDVWDGILGGSEVGGDECKVVFDVEGETL